MKCFTVYLQTGLGRSQFSERSNEGDGLKFLFLIITSPAFETRRVSDPREAKCRHSVGGAASSGHPSLYRGRGLRVRIDLREISLLRVFHLWREARLRSLLSPRSRRRTPVRGTLPPASSLDFSWWESWFPINESEFDNSEALQKFRQRSIL